MTIDPNLPKLVLEGDTLETLTEISYSKIRQASNNTLTDFRQGSPIAALVEGQVFALSELLYYTNLLPEATALELFRLYGVQRLLGTFTSGTLTFQLANISNVAFTLPIGYSFPYLDSTLVLTTALFIPAGSASAQAGVTGSKVGSIYNADSYRVLVTSTGLNNLQSIYNEEPLTSGTDIEPLATCIARMQRVINTRMTLISQNDYEVASSEILGANSRAIAIPRLGADKVTLEFGNVAVFLLAADGNPASAESIRQLQIALAERSIIGTSVFCFPMELELVSVDIYIQVESVDEQISKGIFTAINDYLKPNNYNGGHKVRHNELAFRARTVNGCKSVESVLINNNAIDFILPNQYTLPKVTTVTISQMDDTGRTIETVYSPDIIGND